MVLWTSKKVSVSSLTLVLCSFTLKITCMCRCYLLIATWRNHFCLDFAFVWHEFAMRKNKDKQKTKISTFVLARCLFVSLKNPTKLVTSLYRAVSMLLSLLICLLRKKNGKDASFSVHLGGQGQVNLVSLLKCRRSPLSSPTGSSLAPPGW